MNTLPDTTDTPLATIDGVRNALAQSDDPTEVAAFHRLSKAAAEYATTKPERFDAQEKEMWAFRRCGEFIQAEPHGSKSLTSKEMGMDANDQQWAVSIAKKPEAWLERFIEERRPEYGQLTEHAAWKAATVHVGQNSGDNEWYTPTPYIDAARTVMGGIDLDPASSVEANKIVGASSFYSIADDGLAHAWAGRIWMNPPYAQPAIEHFTTKLVEEYVADNISAAIVLVNNASETGWFVKMARLANARCDPTGRVQFWHPDKKSAPLQGQTVLYFGADSGLFTDTFRQFGECWVKA